MHCLIVIVEYVFIALSLASNFGPQTVISDGSCPLPLPNTKPKRPGILPLPAFSTKTAPYYTVCFTFKATNLCMRRGGDSTVN